MTPTQLMPNTPQKESLKHALIALILPHPLSTFTTVYTDASPSSPCADSCPVHRKHIGNVSSSRDDLPHRQTHPQPPGYPCVPELRTRKCQSFARANLELAKLQPTTPTTGVAATAFGGHPREAAVTQLQPCRIGARPSHSADPTAEGHVQELQIRPQPTSGRTRFMPAAEIPHLGRSRRQFGKAFRRQAGPSPRLHRPDDSSPLGARQALSKP